MNKNKKFGFTLYPRNYHIDPDIEKSYIEGITQSGHLVTVFFRPTEKDRQEAANNKDKNLPSIQKIADRDFRARNICWAEPDNSKDNPNGILLVEQASPFTGDNPTDNKAWECKWFSVIRELAQTAAPEIGIGYLEINHPFKMSDETAMLARQYEDIKKRLDEQTSENPLQDDQALTETFSKIMKSRKYWFTAVSMKVEDTLTIEHDNINKENILNTVRPIVDQYTQKGIYGGVIIRARHNENVYSSLCSEFHCRFDNETNTVISIDESFKLFWEQLERYALPRILRNKSIVLDIIPTVRVNAAPMATAGIAEDIAKPVSKYLNTYVTSNAKRDPMNLNRIKNSLIHRVCIRMAAAKVGAGAGNLLMSTIHAYSSGICSALEVGKNGKRQYNAN